MPYETTIGFRHLKSRKKASISVITGICMLGVVLGVTALVTVLSVTEGFQEVFRDKVLGLNGHVLIMKYGIDFTEYEEVVERARRTEGVKGASPFIFHEMMLSAGTELSGVLIKGVDPRTVGQVSELPEFMEQGSLDTLAPTDGATPAGIIVGAELAERLGVALGDPVTIVSPLRGLDPETWAPRDLTPTSSTFAVTGIFRSGFYEYDKRLVYVHLKALQDFFAEGDVVTGVEIAVDNIFASRDVASRVKVQLGSQRYDLADWTERYPELASSLRARVDLAQGGLGLLVALGAAALVLGFALSLPWLLVLLGAVAGCLVLFAVFARPELLTTLPAWVFLLLPLGMGAYLLSRRLPRLSLRAATLLGVAGTLVVGAGFWGLVALTGYSTSQRASDLYPDILVQRADAPFIEWRNAVQEAEFLKGVLAAGPLATGRALLAPPESAGPVEPLKLEVRGFDPTSGVLSYTPFIVDGTTDGLSRPLMPDAPPPGALLSAALARARGYSVGQMIELTPDGPETDSAPGPAPVRLELIGLIDTGNPADQNTIVLDFPVARRMFSTVDAASGVMVRLANPLDAASIATELRTRLGGTSYRTLDWKEINRNLFASLSLQKQVLSLIVFAMVLVAMFNIVSTLFIIVVDKSREISILKSMGATSGGIMRIFMLEGVTIGAVGTLLGLLLGVVACAIISSIDFPLDPKVYLIGELPVRPLPREFMMTAGVAMVTSVLATIYPSLKAASLPPVEGLRYDR